MSVTLAAQAANDDALEGRYQLIYVRSRALKEAVKWAHSPGMKPSDVVAAAVWFEDFLINGENYERPDDTDRKNTALEETGSP